MSMNLAPNSRRRGARRAPAMMHDINVTPMVDVMLVLLVIFMVAAPLLTVGVPVDLPNTKAPTLNTSEEPVTVTYTNDYKLFLQETPVEMDELTARLAALVQQNSELKVYVRGDQGLTYGDMMGLMGDIRSAGIEHVALVGMMPEGGTQKAMKRAEKQQANQSSASSPKPLKTPSIDALPKQPSAPSSGKPSSKNTAGKWGETSGPMPSPSSRQKTPASARG